MGVTPCYVEVWQHNSILQTQDSKYFFSDSSGLARKTLNLARKSWKPPLTFKYVDGMVVGGGA
jgi:hypothetical protein